MKITDKNFLIEMFANYDFNIEQYINYKVISQGHINTTYILYFDYGNRVKRYLLQEINTNVFKNPDQLMSNIYKVTTYGKDVLKDNLGSEYKNKILRIYPSKDKKSYVLLSDGSYWRVYHYVENSITYDTSSDAKVFYEAGHIIGEFQNILSDFPVDELYPIIENFHDTIKRYQRFNEVLSHASEEIKNTCREEIRFFKENSEIAYKIQTLINEKKMPLRVTHNDTKLNNLMFEYGTNKGQCIVDLDTVMPGCLCFDFGDFVRSACNKGLEDAKDLSTIIFQKDLCLEFTKGFLERLKDSITSIELNNLIMGALDMTYECGMRFLTDYLEGNVYFKVAYPEHNLIRCRTQIRMCQQIMDNQVELENRVIDLFKSL